MAGWDRIKLIACGGQDKVNGLIAHEAIVQAGAGLTENQAEVMCLARIVVGNIEAIAKLEGVACITVDGCARKCASKNVEIYGGDIRRQIVIADTIVTLETEDVGSIAELNQRGLSLAGAVAQDVTAAVKELGSKGGNV